MKGHLDIKRSPMAAKVQSNKAFDGNTVNPGQPHVKHPTPHAKTVSIAPAINKGLGGPDGGKRIIQDEGKPAGRDAAIGKSTYRAPRNDSVGDPTTAGYTRINMDMGAKGNGRGNGKR